MSSDGYGLGLFDLELEVVDAEGVAVAGATIDVIENDFVARACGWPLHEQGKQVTDSAGRARLCGLPVLRYGSRHYVVALHPGYAEGILDHAESLPRADGVASARIVLTRGVALAGKMGEPPAEGEELTVRAVWDDPSVPGCYGVVRDARVAADGSFHLDGLHPGPHVLRLLCGDALVGRTRAEVPSAEPVVVARVRVRDVTGIVLDENGAAVEGADIYLRNAAIFRDTTTNADGRFVIRDVAASQTLTLEAYRLETLAVSREMLSRHTVPAGEEDVDLSCDARERTPVDFFVRGVVAGETMLMVRGESESYAYVGSFTESEVSGRLWLPAGHYDIFVQGGCEEANGFVPTHYAKAAVDSREAQPLRLACDLVPTFSVAFDFKEELTGEPIVGARLCADPLGLWGCIFMENSDDSGRVRLNGLGAIGLRLVVKAPGYEPLTRELEVREAQPPIELRMHRCRQP